jgi:hypothetical protein
MVQWSKILISRIQTELYLVANIKKGEGSRYFCEVTYSTAVDGQKAEETIKIMYPETGCIGIAGSECKEFKTGFGCIVHVNESKT